MVTHHEIVGDQLGFTQNNIMISLWVSSSAMNKHEFMFSTKINFVSNNPGYTQEQQGETNLILHNDLQFNDSIYPTKTNYNLFIPLTNKSQTLFFFCYIIPSYKKI